VFFGGYSLEGSFLSRCLPTERTFARSFSTDQVIPLEVQLFGILRVVNLGAKSLEHGLQSRKCLLGIRNVVVDPTTIELLKLTLSVNDLPLKGGLSAPLFSPD
jgi:hypothetical protein